MLFKRQALCPMCSHTISYSDGNVLPCNFRVSVLTQGSKATHIHHTSICTNRKCRLCTALLITTDLLNSVQKKKKKRGKYLIAWNLVTVINNLYSIFNFFNNDLNETSPPGREQCKTFFSFFFLRSSN